MITIVGKKQAREGFIFLHKGKPKKCRDCKFCKVCMEKLEPNRVYEVIEVREQRMPCLLHEDGAQVVRVQEATIRTTIPAKWVFEGAVVAFQLRECEHPECENYGLCHPVGLMSGDRCKIVESNGRVTCQTDTERALATVLLRRTVR
ncbi:UPF0179 family protein [Candidatus Bathyarchaeota archaeon]|nr:UPF0179 family protein [Candidatus Bathyarchaeota archaeon]